jgi:hypothetical protein
MLRPAPITAFVGVNGSGKTLTAVAFGLVDLKKTGRPLVTNVGGLSADHIPFEDVEDLPELLAEVGSCNLLMDEAGSMFASRDAGRNKAFQRTVQQLRKYDARLLWTAPAFARADKILREVTFDVILCRPMLKVRVPGKAWPSTRLIWQKRFDVSRLDSSGMTINKNAKSKGFAVVRTAKWQHAFDSFHVAGGPAPSSRVDVAVEGDEGETAE